MKSGSRLGTFLSAFVTLSTDTGDPDRWSSWALAWSLVKKSSGFQEVDLERYAEQSVAINPFALACSAIDLPCDSSAV